MRADRPSMHRMRAMLASLMCLCSCSSALTSQKHATTAASYSTKRSALEAIFNASTLPGVCLAEVDVGSATQYAFGYANLETKKLYTEHTVQAVGSVSKLIIGASLAIAADQHLLALTDAVDLDLKFRVVHPAAQDSLTLLQLATHTSSIVDDEDIYNATYEYGRSSPSTTLSEWLSNIFTGSNANKLFSSAAPGTQYNYSNVGASLAALAIQTRARQSFDDFSAHNVFTPAGMHETSWGKSAPQRGNPSEAATLYDTQRKALAQYASLSWPDGSMHSSCHDLALLAQLLVAATSDQAQTVISKSAASQWIAPRFSPQWQPSGTPSSDANHGLFVVHRKNGYIGHTGSDPGVSSFLFVDPIRRRGYLMLTNIDVQESKQLAESFVALWKALTEDQPKH
jgi:CubicO group peptidase (beta-lactamase class C family)